VLRAMHPQYKSPTGHILGTVDDILGNGQKLQRSVRCQLQIRTKDAQPGLQSFAKIRLIKHCRPHGVVRAVQDFE
ncbi:hypothetical protein ACV35H_33700, partial [Pseudomonas aeruginosa]